MGEILTIQVEVTTAELNALELLARQQPPKTAADILADEVGCLFRDHFRKVIEGFKRAERLELRPDLYFPELNEGPGGAVVTPGEAQDDAEGAFDLPEGPPAQDASTGSYGPNSGPSPKKPLTPGAGSGITSSEE